MKTAALAACLLAALAACAADSPSVVIVDQPVTIRIEVPSAVRRAENIALQLDQVAIPKAASATWNMFVELPTAGKATPVELPNFAGYVTTVPNPTARSSEPKGMTLQLPDAAAALVKKLSAVRLTFVPASDFGREGVRIRAVRLEPLR